MENSIEEDIARIAKLITTKFNNDYSIDNKDKEAIEHILSDYKRVLKENEELKYKVEGQECVIETQAHNEEVYERIFKRLEKENEELKSNSNDSVVAIKLYSLQKDNEQLRTEVNSLEGKLDEAIKENEELGKFITEGIEIKTNSPYKNYSLEFLRNNFIPIQKVKDKIEDLYKEDRKWTEELSEPDSNFKNIDRNLKRIKNQTEVLKGLLESEEN